MFKSEKGCCFYVGTYTNRHSEGIYLYMMDLNTGHISPEGLAARMESPSYMTGFHDAFGNYFLYAVSETERFDDRYGSGVAAFSADALTGLLTHINTCLTNGKDACHLGISPSHRLLLAANYSEGSFTEFAIDKSGALSKTGINIIHEGRGPDNERQEMSHPHYVKFLSEDLICAIDLGIDKVMFYENGEGWKQTGLLGLKPGSGPRHAVFDEARSIFYVFCELSGDVVVVRNSKDYRHFDVVQTINSLPGGFRGKNTGAAIRFSSNKRFIYVSNRGADSITIFRIHNDGMLELLNHTPTHGRTPRDFNTTPDGNWLIAANQDSGSLTVFSVDKDSGALRFTGETQELDRPVCIL